MINQQSTCIGVFMALLGAVKMVMELEFWDNLGISSSNCSGVCYLFVAAAASVKTIKPLSCCHCFFCFFFIYLYLRVVSVRAYIMLVGKW